MLSLDQLERPTSLFSLGRLGDSIFLLSDLVWRVIWSSFVCDLDRSLNFLLLLAMIVGSGTRVFNEELGQAQLKLELGFTSTKI